MTEKINAEQSHAIRTAQAAWPVRRFPYHAAEWAILLEWQYCAIMDFIRPTRRRNFGAGNLMSAPAGCGADPSLDQGESGRIKIAHLKDWPPAAALMKSIRVSSAKGVSPWKEIPAALESAGWSGILSDGTGRQPVFGS